MRFNTNKWRTLHRDAHLPGSLAAVQEDRFPVPAPTAMRVRLTVGRRRSQTRWHADPFFLDSRRLPGRLSPLTYTRLQLDTIVRSLILAPK